MEPPTPRTPYRLRHPRRRCRDPRWPSRLARLADQPDHPDHIRGIGWSRAATNPLLRVGAPGRGGLILANRLEGGSGNEAADPPLCVIGVVVAPVGAVVANAELLAALFDHRGLFSMIP